MAKKSKAESVKQKSRVVKPQDPGPKTPDGGWTGKTQKGPPQKRKKRRTII